MNGRVRCRCGRENCPYTLYYRVGENLCKNVFDGMAQGEINKISDILEHVLTDIGISLTDINCLIESIIVNSIGELK